MDNVLRGLSADERELWQLMLAASRRIGSALEESLQDETGHQRISSADFAVLAALAEADSGEMRLRDLCAALQWDRSRTSHHATRMANRGLIRKKPSPADARGVVVGVTGEGVRRLQAAAPKYLEALRRSVFDHLDPAAAGHLEAFLRGVVGAEGVGQFPGQTARG